MSQPRSAKEADEAWALERQPPDPEPARCYYCDPYGYPYPRMVGSHVGVCLDHSRLVPRAILLDAGLPSGRRASWTRGVWA